MFRTISNIEYRTRLLEVCQRPTKQQTNDYCMLQILYERMVDVRKMMDLIFPSYAIFVTTLFLPRNEGSSYLLNLPIIPMRIYDHTSQHNTTWKSPHQQQQSSIAAAANPKKVTSANPKKVTLVPLFGGAKFSRK